MPHEPVIPEAIDQAHRPGLARMATRLGEWKADFVLQTIARLVAHGELELMTRFMAGLQCASDQGLVDLSEPQWQGLALAPADWLRDPDSGLRAFADDWLNAFRGSASVAEVATREVVASLDPHKHAGFRRERAQHLVELVLERSASAADADLSLGVGLGLAPVVDKLLEVRARAKNTKELKTRTASLANDAVLFEHVLRLDSARRPQQLLVLAAGDNLVRRLLRNDKGLCLNVLEKVYGPDHPARPVLCEAACLAMREEIVREDFRAAPLFIDSVPIVLGWLDADTANAILSLPCHNYSLRKDEAEIPLIHTYGAVLAANGVYVQEAMGVVRALHRSGGNLDMMSRPRDRVDGVTRHTWSGTLLHQAVARGTPEFVRFLLALGCDPYLKTTLQGAALEVVLEEDCFGTIARIEAAAQHDRELDPLIRRRHVGVGEALRGWRAHRAATNVLADLLRPAAAGSEGPAAFLPPQAARARMMSLTGVMA